jgi:hypothetical protein
VHGLALNRGHMKTIHCPICSSQLESQAVAPCFDCGHSPSELGECERGEHEYHIFSIWGQEIALCDFCDADFGSYFPDYFSLPPGPLPDYPLELLHKIETPINTHDFYCPKCMHRLAFLNFLSKVRVHNAA